MLNSAMFSSDSSVWETPSELFEHYNRIFRFDVDLAALWTNRKLPVYIPPALDSLSQPWMKWGRVGWLNPPYGRGLGAWVKKAHEETKNGFTTVMLLPARTDTSWFHDWIADGRARITFLRGRIKFVGASNGAPFPSMIVVFDAKPVRKSD